MEFQKMLVNGVRCSKLLEIPQEVKMDDLGLIKDKPQWPSEGALHYE